MAGASLCKLLALFIVEEMNNIFVMWTNGISVGMTISPAKNAVKKEEIANGNEALVAWGRMKVKRKFMNANVDSSPEKSLSDAVSV